MIGYITLGTNDMNQATSFYDSLFKEVGASRVFDLETFVAWGIGKGSPAFAVTKPFDGAPATVGNGVMIALAAKSTDVVDALHAKALALGAKNEGDPGLRRGVFYCAYFRDLEGNKLNFFCLVK
jgi:hypothetical protein